MSSYVHLGLRWIGSHGGGLERYQDGLCSAHARLGTDVTAWVQCQDIAKDARAYQVITYASPAEKRRVKIKKLQALANERFATPDFVFVSHHASVSSRLVRLAKRVAHVVHFHGPWADEAAVEGAPAWKTFLQRRDELKVYRNANRIITLSNAFKQLITTRYGIPDDVISVIPGAIDTEAANPNVSRQEARLHLGWPSDRPIVLTLRRLVRRVGADVLIEAVASLVRNSRQFKDLLVMIGGTGPLFNELNQRIIDLELCENIQLLGFVDDKHLSTVYRAADFTIVPTQALEGFGLVTLESMAAGTPVIVTPVGSLPEVMQGLNSNLILQGKTANDIAEGLKHFLLGKTSLPSDDACRSYVRNQFDWSVIAPRVLDVYRNASIR